MISLISSFHNERRYKKFLPLHRDAIITLFPSKVQSQSTNCPIAMHLRERRCAYEGVSCAYVIVITDWAILGAIRIRGAKVSLSWLVDQTLLYLTGKISECTLIVWNCVVDVIIAYHRVGPAKWDPYPPPCHDNGCEQGCRGSTGVRLISTTRRGSSINCTWYVCIYEFRLGWSQ